ncbi:MAG: oligosaccharide flippase family protein [Opitutales bacterium]|nr:oligosaccharide flippase family protein [Opitutales bacterium]
MPFARILRSSALMGGAQAVTLAMAFLRSKLIAVLIGPAGIGLMGVFNAFNANVSTVAGWGLGTSAVRTVAGAAEADKERKVAAVRHFGRRLAWAGFIGVLILVLPVGYLTFKSQEYALELLIAGLAVPCVVATGMWTALLQAGGHIGSMARTQMASSVVGLLIGLPFIYFFGSVGIALSILLAAAATALVTWRAATKFSPPTSVDPATGDIRELVHLGVALQIGATLGAISTYLVRVLILRSHGDDLAAGLADAGFYQAAFAVTGSLPGVIFSATSSDFYPRVAAAKDEDEARYITEKQIQASLLLATPILMGLLTMGPLAIRFLYAKGFEPAVPLLDWFVWAIYFFLMGWPLGFWLTARGSKRTVAIFQSLSYFLMVALGLVLIPLYGVKGAAAGYLGCGIIYAGILLAFTRRLSGHWISVRTFFWFGVVALTLGLSRWAVSFADGLYWGAIPTALTAAICAFIYFRVITKSKAEEASA